MKDFIDPVNLKVVGISYKTAPVEVREKLTFTEKSLEKALGAAKEKEEISAKLKEVRTSEDFKVGIAYHKLVNRIKKKKTESQKKEYAKFAQKYPDTFYGKQAAELAE